jgi:glycosyltransferase involved in cell wall biosynthesis
MNCAIAHPNGPIAFLRLGGTSEEGCSCTARLIHELGRAIDVITIDLSRDGSEHKMRQIGTGFPGLSLVPQQPHMTTLSQSRDLCDSVKGTLAIPNVQEAVSRLRGALHHAQPRAVCVEDEHALYVAWLALSPDLPLVYLVTSELSSIRSDCAPAWCRVDAALGISEYSLRYLRPTRYAHGNLHVVGSGIDVENTLARAGEGESGGGEPPENDRPSKLGEARPLRIASPISFPRPLKGHQSSIVALASLRQMGTPAELWFCVQKCRPARPSGSPMLAMAADLGVRGHIRVLGQQQTLLSTMARSDVTLFSSSAEGRPQRLLEAMALGKPVVATRTGITSEFVRDGVDGILVEPEDVQATVDALKRLSDPALRERMGAAGQRRARTEFSPERQAVRFLSVVDGLDEPRWQTRNWSLNTNSL